MIYLEPCQKRKYSGDCQWCLRCCDFHVDHFLYLTKLSVFGSLAVPSLTNRRVYIDDYKRYTKSTTPFGSYQMGHHWRSPWCQQLIWLSMFWNQFHIWNQLVWTTSYEMHGTPIAHGCILSVNKILISIGKT
jgi:hypothetical protein